MSETQTQTFVSPPANQSLALSDVLVFFGATGDLAHKKVFPALQAMIRKGNLNVPVIGVAKGEVCSVTV
jgi:glucose-6-phosphate 1-dehydrogenase